MCVREGGRREVYMVFVSYTRDSKVKTNSSTKSIEKAV